MVGKKRTKATHAYGYHPRLPGQGGELHGQELSDLIEMYIGLDDFAHNDLELGELSVKGLEENENIELTANEKDIVRKMSAIIKEINSLCKEYKRWRDKL